MPEATFRILMKGHPSVIWVSEGVEALLGYKPEDFLNSAINLAERTHPHDVDIVARLLSPDVAEGAGPLNLRMRHADGRIRCLRCHGRHEVQANGDPVLHLTLQDAKSVQAEQNEHARQVNLASVIESVDEGVFLKDRHHVITGANLIHRLALCDSAGQPRDLVGLTDYDLYPEEVADRIYAAEERIFAGAPSIHAVREGCNRGGKKSWTDVRKFPVKDDRGEIIGLFGIAREITDQVLAEQALRESTELLQLFIKHAPAALAMLDREMRYLAVSRRWLEMHGLVGQKIIGHSHYDVMPDIPEHWRETHRRALLGEVFKAGEEPLPRGDGRQQWVRREVRPWKTGDGEVGGIIIFSDEVTQQKQAEERLHLAANVFTHASEGIVITDANARILDVNDAFTRITGYSREEVLGRNPSILKSGHQGKEFYENMWNDLIDKGEWRGEIWNRSKNGQVYAEMLTISAVPDANGKPKQYVALFSDVTSIKEQEQKLERIAHYDLLTGLPNRVLLADRMHQAMAQAHRRNRPVAIACLDLDNFRAINDRYGRITGDRLLTAVTQRMKCVLHEDDTLARLGGDEFVAVLPGLEDTASSIAVLNALLAAAAGPIRVGDLDLELSSSLGVTFFPQADDVDADQLLRQADQAMYRAKLEGKNRYHFFDPRFDRSIRGHHEDLERIRRALEANEFVLHFQPKVNMRTGALLGVEALIRWQHPERGLLAPAKFLAVLEGHPLSMKLDEWVIDNALKQIEVWRRAGLDMPVSVNIGAQQLQQSGFVDRLRSLLAAHPAVAPSRLELEVLESSALQDVSTVSQVIRACSRLGVSFALDDFGTGYSSLTYLKRLPVDVLKIDQTFVREMHEDPENLTILEGVIGLAAAFRRVAVAEGVETVEHGLTLLRLGCEAAQGYGIARPMPGGDVPGWVASWHPYPQWANVTPVHPGDRPLLYAAVEHRAWVLAIEAFLNGLRYTAPEMGREQCRFGAWLGGEASTAQRETSALREIDELHQRVHSVAAEILVLKAEDRRQQAMDHMTVLHALSDALLAKLERLIDTV